MRERDAGGVRIKVELKSNKTTLSEHFLLCRSVFVLLMSKTCTLHCNIKHTRTHGHTNHGLILSSLCISQAERSCVS